MCWSFEVSIIIGTISYSVATYLWIRNYENDRWHSAILFTVSTIQFLEAIIWHMNKNGADTTNITKIVIMFLIPLVLSLEPIASLFGAQYSGKKISDYDKIFFVIIFVIMFMTLTTNNSYPNIFVNNTIRYRKNDNFGWHYWIFFILLMYPLIKYSENNIFYIILYVIVGMALIFSLNKKSPGSTWCLYGNIIAILLLFYPYLNKKFINY